MGASHAPPTMDRVRDVEVLVKASKQILRPVLGRTEHDDGLIAKVHELLSEAIELLEKV